MSQTRSFRSALVLTSVVFVAVATGCGAEQASPAESTDAQHADAATRTRSASGQERSTPAARSFVGTLAGTDAYVSVSVAEDGNAVVYLCDGADLVEYLDGMVNGEGLLEASEPFGTFVRAEISGADVTGTVTMPDGSEHALEASAADDDAGALWLEERPDGATVVLGGWIRLADGSVRGKSQVISVGSDPGISDGTSNTVDGGDPIPPQAQPTGVVRDLRCGRVLRKQVQAAEVYRQATPGPDPGFHTPEQDAAYGELLALERQADALGCIPNPGSLLVA